MNLYQEPRPLPTQFSLERISRRLIAQGFRGLQKQSSLIVGLSLHKITKLFHLLCSLSSEDGGMTSVDLLCCFMGAY